jgi:hypothetical protein
MLRVAYQEVSTGWRYRRLPPGPGVSDTQVVDRLRLWATRLAGAADRQSAVRFVPETWCRWLAQVPDPQLQMAATDTDALLRWLEVALPKIDRPHLRHLATEGSGPEANLRLFVAVLVWGRGTSNGRMLPHMVRALGAANRDLVLKATAVAATERRLAGAYDGWTLPGLREGFFTKWLWASGTRSLKPGPVPLVLDSRVWRSLNNGLGWNSLIAAQSFSWSDRYAAYCETIARWAAGLSEEGRMVSAEDLEFGLFYANGKLERLNTVPAKPCAGS